VKLRGFFGRSSRANPDVPKVIPALRLDGRPVLPGWILDFVASTPAALEALARVEKAEHKHVLLTLPRERPSAEARLTNLMGVACLARIDQTRWRPGGARQVTVTGASRVRLLSEASSKPALMLKFEWLDDLPHPETATRCGELRELLPRFFELVSTLPDATKKVLQECDEPGRFADLFASQLLATDGECGELLRAVDIGERLSMVHGLAARDCEERAMRASLAEKAKLPGARIGRVERRIAELRAELGADGEDNDAELGKLRERVRGSGMTPEATAECHREIARMGSLENGSLEYALAENYVEWLLALPWSLATAELAPADARRVLDERHFGLVAVKERVLEYLAVLHLRGGQAGRVLCFSGPPGVGKTSIAYAIAGALARRVVRVSLGGLSDEAEIRGHRRTYVGSLPGQIIQAMRRAGAVNPVIVLDEIDKLTHGNRGNPAGALLEVLDPVENQHFRDHYLAVPYDLSRVLFIATCNTTHGIDSALLDRLDIVEFGAYSTEEKRHIARDHLFPKHAMELGLLSWDVSEASVLRLVLHHAREAGVREIGRDIQAILRRRALVELEARQGGNVADSVDAIVERFLDPLELQDRRGAVVKGLDERKQLIEALDQEVVGQSLAKDGLVHSAVLHYSRLPDLRAIESRVPPPLLVFAGPASVGKSLLARQFAACLGLPFATIDASVNPGRIQELLDAALAQLIEMADGDLSRAGRGVLVLEHLDALVGGLKDRERSSRLSVLGLLQREELEVPIHSSLSSVSVRFRTSELLIIVES
jgi:ATP-dependent Lon protease